MTIAANIKAARLAVGLSQNKAAPLAGITQAYWSLIEAGKRSPSIGILKRMARALGVKVGALVR